MNWGQAKYAYSLLAAILLIGLIGRWGFLHVGDWLSKSDAPQRVDVIICLGGTERVKKAASLYKEGLAPQVILTTVQHRDALIRYGVPAESIVVPARQPYTTYQEALAVAPILRQRGYRSAMVVSDPPHLYRVRWIFHHVLGEESIRLFFISSEPAWAKGFWWDSHQNRVFVLTELPKIVYYWLAHGLLGLKDDPQWTIDLKCRYERFMRKIVP